MCHAPFLHSFMHCTFLPMFRVPPMFLMFQPPSTKCTSYSYPNPLCDVPLLLCSLYDSKLTVSLSLWMLFNILSPGTRRYSACTMSQAHCGWHTNCFGCLMEVYGYKKVFNFLKFTLTWASTKIQAYKTECESHARSSQNFHFLENSSWKITCQVLI